jgi:hypothetical protein
MFDPLEFGISMKEGQYLDPSLRLTLEAAHQVSVSSLSPVSSAQSGIATGFS